MRFFVLEKEVSGDKVLPDDFVFTAASKIGGSGLYIYGKCALKTTAKTLISKYRRPLTKKEMALELRNIGQPPRELGRSEYTEEDMQNVASSFVFVALGQVLPDGLAVQPRWKYPGSTKGRLLPQSRLLDYNNLLEVYAVKVPDILEVFYSCAPLHVATPDDAALKMALSAVPPHMVVVKAETRIPSNYKAAVDARKILQIYRRVHATTAIPEISLRGAPTRRDPSAAVYRPLDAVEDGIVCRFKGGAVASTFNPDGSLKVSFSSDEGSTLTSIERMIRNLVNPFVNLVNNTLLYDGPLEMDAAAATDADTFSNTPFPLFESFADGGETSIDVRVKLQGHLMFPMHVPLEWAAAFSSGPSYQRGHIPEKMDLEHCSESEPTTLVTVRNLRGPSYASCAAYYVRGLLNAKSSEEDTGYVSPNVSLDEEGTHKMQKFTLYRPLEKVEKHGYVISSFSDSAATIRHEGKQCTVPLTTFSPVPESPSTVAEMDAEQTAAFLEELAQIIPVQPVGWVYDAKCNIVGVATEYGESVKCKKSPVVKEDWYGMYCSLIGSALRGAKDPLPLRSAIEKAESDKIVFARKTDSNLPRRIAGRVVFPHELSANLRKRLLHEVVTNVHRRCILLNWVERFGTVIFDKFPDELIS